MAVVLLLFLAVLPILEATDVYYVTADANGHEQSCPPHQICHNLSYYISQPDFFTSDTTIILLEGEHKLNEKDLVHVSNVHNLTLKGQGQWPVAGAEETVMQSTVIINCTRGKGGFYFANSQSVTVQGLTVINCGGLSNKAVFYFTGVYGITFQKNSIQRMTGYGLYVLNCDNVTITNSSYYQSAECKAHGLGGGVGIEYGKYTQRTNATYQVELSYSNMTKCCNYRKGGGIYFHTSSKFYVASVLFNHLVLSHNSARSGGNLVAVLINVSLVIKNCIFANGSAHNTGGIYISAVYRSNIKVQDTLLLENSAPFVSELNVYCFSKDISFSLLNSEIKHTKTDSTKGVLWISQCGTVSVTNSRMQVSNQSFGGLFFEEVSFLKISNSLFKESINVFSVLLISQSLHSQLRNCSFSNNSGHSAIMLHHSRCFIYDSTISDNNMTAITVIQSLLFEVHGRTVIQNNRYKEGAGITIVLPGKIVVIGQLYMYNNTADEHGGAILALWLRVDQPLSSDCDIKSTENTLILSLDFANFQESSSKKRPHAHLHS